MKWNGNKNLPFFKSNNCSKVRGSDGMKFKSGLTQADTLYILNVNDFCSGIPFKYKGPSSVQGIDTLRFEFAFRNNEEDCYDKNGFLSVADCNQNAPIYFSAPHFYNTWVGNYPKINGLNPDKTMHESYMEVDPVTGILMKIRLRFQVNVLATKHALFSMTKELGDLSTMVPLIWVEFAAETDKVSVGKLKTQVFNKIFIFRIVCGVAIGLGLVVIGFVLFKQRQAAARDAAKLVFNMEHEEGNE